MKSVHQKRAERHEKRTAEEIGGTITPMSGAGSAKGDVANQRELWECKTTTAKQWTLRLVDLLKVRQQALVQGKDPVFCIEFAAFPDCEFVVVSKQDYLEDQRDLSQLRGDGQW